MLKVLKMILKAIYWRTKVHISLDKGLKSTIIQENVKIQWYFKRKEAFKP